MKTFNILYLSIILLSTSLFSADKTYSFIGIQAGNTFEKSNNIPTIGLKYGQQSKNYRTSLTYSYGKNSKTSYQTLMAQVDVGIFQNSFRNLALKPYAGFSFGVMQENDQLSSVQDRGYLYGVNTGLAYIFNDDLDFDLGYRYLKTEKLNNIDSLNEISLSMNYFY